VEAAEQRMKLTRLSAAPGWLRGYQTRGAASCPRRRETAGTASQRMRRVGPTMGGVPEAAAADERKRERWLRFCWLLRRNGFETRSCS
jgi:hypothetical protein